LLVPGVTDRLGVGDRRVEPSHRPPPGFQRDFDRLYWRSRTNNPLNAWYYARCQGSFRTNAHFTVFWYGDDRFEDGASLITDALSKPVTILPVPRDT